MSSSAKVWLTVGPAALAAAALSLVLIFTSEHEEQPLLTSMLGLAIGLSFLVAGMIAQTRRPENRTGVLLLVVGFAFFAGVLSESNESILFTAGFAVGAVFIAALIHLLLAYPGGRLTSRWERVVVGLSYAVALGANLVPLLFDREPAGECEECPANALLIVDSPTADTVTSGIFDTLGVVLLLLVAVTLVRRWRRSSPTARRLLGPVLLAGGATFVCFGVSIAIWPISHTAAEVIGWTAAVPGIGVPFLFLWGILRSRLTRADIDALLEAPETPTLVETQDLLRETLHDPTLQLVYWVDVARAYFSTDGRKVDLAKLGDDRMWCQVDSGGEPLAAIIHDPALLDEPGRLANVTAALRLRLEKDRSVRALRISEYRSRALIEAIPDTIFRMARDGTIIDIQAHDPENLILPLDELLGRSVFELPPEIIAPEVLEERRTLVERAFETGEAQSQQYELNTHFGHRIAEARIVPSGEDEFVMIVRDITDEKLAESRSQALLEALPDRMFRLTRDGRYLDFRTRDADGKPVEPERFLGASLQDTLPPGIVERVLAAAERAFDTGEVQTIEGEMESERGTFYAEARIVASGHDEFVMIVRDVTDRVRQEERIQAERDYFSTLIDATPSLICTVDYDGRLTSRPINESVIALTGYGEKDVARRPFSEVFSAPEDAATVERVIAAAAAGEAPGEQETHWLTRDGRRVLVAWTCTPLPEREAARRLVISGTDVTERKRREDEQAALRRVAVAVASERRPETVFQTVTEEIVRLLGGDKAQLVRFEAGDEAVVLGSWAGGRVDAEIIGERIHLTGGPLTEVRATGRTVRLESGPSLAAPVRERLEAAEAVSVVAAPVHVSGLLWGAVVVSAADVAFPAEAEERIGQFTSLVATAIANAEAREELHASRARIVEAGDAERRRLERNLHDGAQQRLVSLSLSLRLAQAKLVADPHAADEIISSASIELGLALEELRELARGIHPAVLTDRGLGPALETLADRAPLPVELAELPDSRLPEPVEAAAFYVVSEALANVSKYADASTVSVRVAHQDGFAVVEVADDGVGGADPRSGSGLRGLADRIEALNGHLAVESPPGAGTRIRAEIPVRLATP